VTLNKPQGLPVTGMGMGREEGKAGVEMVGWHAGSLSSSLPGRPGELTLLSVLPQLSQALGLEHQELQVVRAPGK
jgi:hypothetical protein